MEHVARFAPPRTARLRCTPTPWKPIDCNRVMIILLFRHGPAGKADPARWPDDRVRPLTRRGVKRTTLAARGIATLVEKIDLVVTSPLIRAAETARLLAEQVGTM